jgi:hypothetical protein
MATVNGDVEITLGSEDPITLQLLEDDGVTPINLSQITGLTLYMRDTDDGSLKEITGERLEVTDMDNGKIKLSQIAADFPVAASYRYKIKFVDPGSKQHFVPDGSKWYIFTVYNVT